MVIFAVAQTPRDKTYVSLLPAGAMFIIYTKLLRKQRSQGQTMQAIRVSAFTVHDASANECNGHAVNRRRWFDR